MPRSCHGSSALALQGGLHEADTQLQVQDLHSTCHWNLERVILLHALLQQDDALLLHNPKPTAMGGQTFNNSRTS